MATWARLCLMAALAFGAPTLATAELAAKEGAATAQQAAPAVAARADAAMAIAPRGGVSYELIGRWDAARLNRVLTEEMPKFSDAPVTFTPAVNGVRLYRITYQSVVPERGNRPITATGLLALPETADGGLIHGRALPLVSYQHGTVFGKQQVPSFPEQSDETRLMLAQFAGQGYALIGADYFGMGASQEPEGYGVKASHQQATLDMLLASRAVLAELKVTTGPLFLAGWSQGGLVTFAFLEKLERLGIPVKAASTASAPVDIYSMLSGFLNFPRPNDAKWISTLFILSAFSFENYYGVPGLARALFQDSVYDAARRVYLREKVDAPELPTDLHKLIRPEYFDPQYFAHTAYGRLAAQTTAYRWVVQTPVRAYYGEADEVIRTGLGRLPMQWQQSMGNEKVEAISTGPTDHRGVFVTATPQWKSWFDALARGD